MRVSNKWKAVVGAVSTFLGVIGTVLADDVIGLDEVPTMVGAGVALGAVVYGLVFATPPGKDLRTPETTNQPK